MYPIGLIAIKVGSTHIKGYFESSDLRNTHSLIQKLKYIT